MLNNRNEKLALIHLAKKDRALDDDAYRALLLGAAGIESAADIESATQFDAVMLSFKRLGFKSAASIAVKKSPYCSKRQLGYIKRLWNAGSREKSEAALRKMVKRIGHVDDPKFLDKRSAQSIILALRTMCWNAGKNPDALQEVAEEPRTAL